MNTQTRSRLPVLKLALLLALAVSPLAAQTPPAAAPPPAEIPAPPDVAAPPADAPTTASGIASKVLTPGAGGERPQPQDLVKVNYTGWTTDGKMFDSSVARNKPVVLPLDRVIPGWSEGLQLMTKGEKRRLWIPGKLAYEGKPGRPQGTLVFDVELLDILHVPSVPPDVAAPPADAQVTASGLASKRLAAGTGTVHPKADSYVRVEYTGWTTDGKMFDSSIPKGGSAFFKLQETIPGWIEGVQLMVEGERRRFWIPEKLAYKGAPGKPKGTLVFDVELVKITKE